MNERNYNLVKINCRKARKLFPALTGSTATMGNDERGVVERHIESCARCEREYRIFELARATLDAAATPEPIKPGDDFFVALRARIERGPEQVAPARGATLADDLWASILVAARQLIPAMAMLLILIIGASLLWNTAPPNNGNNMAVLPSEKVLFSDVYDLAQPTPDDVLETLVAVEERTNGK